MHWKKALAQHAEQLGRVFHDVESGCGIEFQDECDVFWVLPTEPNSTVTCPDGTSPTADELIALYDNTNELRFQSLHVLSYLLGKEYESVFRYKGGSWQCSTKSQEETVEVGRVLTQVAMDSKSVDEIFKSKSLWWPKSPGKNWIKAYLLEDLPASVTSPKLIDEEEDDDTRLKDLGSCRMFSGNSKKFENLIRELGKRIPDSPASIQLLGHSHLEINYRDGLDFMRLRPRSIRLTKRLFAEPLSEIADEFADRYQQDNDVRTRALNAIWKTVQAEDLKVDCRPKLVGLFKAGAKRAWIGKTLREFSFPYGREFTKLFKSEDPTAAFEKLFPTRLEFAAKCAKAYETADATHYHGIKETPLADPKLCEPYELLALSDDVVEECDELADRYLKEFLDKNDIIYEMRSQLYFNPVTDPWAQPKAAIELAKKWLDQQKKESFRIPGILVLMDLSDPQGFEMANDAIVQCTSAHFEADDDEFELVWRMRHEYPEVMKTWTDRELVHETFDDVLFRCGDPVTTRRMQSEEQLVGSVEPPFEDIDCYTPRHIKKMSAERQQVLREEAANRLRSNHQIGMLDSGMLATICELGWKDAMQQIESNPFLLQGLFCNDAKDDSWDEPGLLMCDALPLYWSAVAPSAFLAQIVATAFKTNFFKLAKEAARRDVRNNPKHKQMLCYALDRYRKSELSLNWHLAIAWKRCRHLIGF